MLGSVLEKLIILGFLCQFFVEAGKDVLNFYKPNPDLPQELNDFLDKVQAHRDDFALIRNLAKKQKHHKPQQDEAIFSLRNEMLPNLEDYAEYHRPVRSDYNAISQDRPINDIFPYMYQETSENQDNFWHNYPNERYSKNIRSPVRLRRGLDLMEDINIESKGKSGEVKRSGEKYPHRKFVPNRKINGRNVLVREPRIIELDPSLSIDGTLEKSHGKREIEIDVKSDGMLVKQIKEDTHDPKSIVLNIESEDSRVKFKHPAVKSNLIDSPVNFQKIENPPSFQKLETPNLLDTSNNFQKIENPITFQKFDTPANLQKADAPVSFQKKSDLTDQVLKNNELDSNYINLVTANENLNTDKSIALQVMNNPTVDYGVISSNLYAIGKNNFNKNLNRLNSEEFTNSMNKKHFKNKAASNSITSVNNNLLNSKNDALDTESNIIYNKKIQPLSEHSVVEEKDIKSNREPVVEKNNEEEQEDVGFEPAQGIAVNEVSTAKIRKAGHNQRTVEKENSRNLNTRDIIDSLDTNILGNNKNDNNNNNEFSNDILPANDDSQPNGVAVPMVAPHNVKQQKTNECEGSQELNNDQTGKENCQEENLQMDETLNDTKEKCTEKPHHKKFTITGHLDIASVPNSQEDDKMGAGDETPEEIDKTQSNGNEDNVEAKEDQASSYKKGDIAVDYGPPKNKLQKFNQSQPNSFVTYLREDGLDDINDNSIENIAEDSNAVNSDLAHFREKRRKAKHRKRKKKRRRRPKIKHRRKHHMRQQKRQIESNEIDDQVEQKLGSNNDYYTYFIDPSNDYDLIPAFKGRRLKSSDDNYEAVADMSDMSTRANRQFAPVFLFQQQESLEGDDNEEEDPLSPRLLKKKVQVTTQCTTEDYDDDDDYRKSENAEPAAHEQQQSPRGKQKLVSNNSHDKKANKIAPIQESKKVSAGNLLDLKNDDKANVARGHGKRKNKSAAPNHKQRNQKKKEQGEEQKIFLKYNQDFQEWPKFVMDDRNYKEQVQKRSLQNSEKLHKPYYFPLSSKNFFMIPKDHRRLRGVNAKRAEAAGATNQADLFTLQTAATASPEAAVGASDAEGESETVMGITQPAEPAKACRKQGRNGHREPSQSCEEENFNKTAVQLTTVLPFIKEAKTAEPAPKVNDTKAFEDFINMDKIMTGKIPAEILNAAYRNAPSRIRSNLKTDGLNLHLNFTTPANSTESIRLMREITRMMSQLQQHAFCQPLSATLRLYLREITKTPQEDVLKKIRSMEEVDVDENQKPYIFQSHQGDNLENKMAVLKDLLDQYNRLPEKCKERAEPVREYIENHLGMLDSMMSSSNTGLNHSKSAMEIIGKNRTKSIGSNSESSGTNDDAESPNNSNNDQNHNLDQTKSKKSVKPLPSVENIKDQLDRQNHLIQEQLESLGLGGKHEFKPRFDLDQMVELNKYANNRKIVETTKVESSSKKTIQKREILQMDETPLHITMGDRQVRSVKIENKGTEVSAQYQRLQDAVSRIKLKEDRERRLASIYEANRQQEGGSSFNENAEGGEVGFEAPLVVRF